MSSQPASNGTTSPKISHASDFTLGANWTRTVTTDTVSSQGVYGSRLKVRFVLGSASYTIVNGWRRNGDVTTSRQMTYGATSGL